MFTRGQYITLEEFLQNTTIRSLSSDEQETNILLNRGGKKCVIYTCDNTMLTKIKKIIPKNPDAWKIQVADTFEGQITGYNFEGPGNIVKLASGKKRAVSDAQREAFKKAVHKNINTMEDTLDEVEDDDFEDESEE